MHSISEDYSGRQRDLEFLQHVAYPVGEYQLGRTSTVSETRQVTGLQKAIQRYVSLLLSPTSTVRFCKGSDNSLLLDLRHGNIPDKARLADRFAYANADTIDLMRADDYNTSKFGDTREDERISNVELVDSSVDRASSKVSLTLEFTTEAGSSYTYVVPVGTSN